jgi:hypothetical protein
VRVEFVEDGIRGVYDGVSSVEGERSFLFL